MSKVLDSINETVMVSLSNKELTIWVKQVEDMVFQPYRSIVDRKGEVDQEEEIESEEEERPSETEEDSSKIFSDDEYEGSIGESFVKDSSPEINLNDQMMMSGGRLKDISREEEIGGKINLEIGNLEKSHVDIGEENEKVINWKGGIESPNENLSPNKKVNKQEAQDEQDKDGKQSAGPNEGFVSPEGYNMVDSKKRLDADIPASLNGVSGRLKELLSKNTPIKEKIKKSIEEIENPEEITEKESAGAFTEQQKKQEQEYNQAQSYRKKEEKKNQCERRITMSQSKRMRIKVSSSDSISSNEYSSNYLHGSVDSDQKIQQIGAKCGIHKEGGIGCGQMKGSKKGSLNGKS
ncbi:hypothetical protein L2E82_24378 [Cichorium intybus]|uniref:Uncharacterized protein n=1 Tax=Cichorium intybus TaxID=13427 RepID=A0ACB9E085_CICIN|nr:hypothetical protein L2E82_24378 [Cichorium intybus]